MSKLDDGTIIAHMRAMNSIARSLLTRLCDCPAMMLPLVPAHTSDCAGARAALVAFDHGFMPEQ